MGDFVIKVLAWVFYGTLFVGLIFFIIWSVRAFATIFTPREKIKVYYEDNDHSKGYYFVGKPGGIYPVGYPKEKIEKEMKAYVRLKQEQKSKSVWNGGENTQYTLKKSRPMWLQILFMTPAEYMEYRRRKKFINSNKDGTG